jgi:ubiquinone/menaquinone biosynthesis C-methylase UbiE
MFKRLINKNFRKPKGLVGRYIIRFLEKNQIEYDEMEPLLGLNAGDTVLEIGYGLGKGIYDFAGRYDCTFVGIDFSRLMYVRARKINLEYIRLGKVQLIQAAFEKYPFDDNTFHCVYFINVSYFWEDISSRLKKILSILKPDGKLIIFMADAVVFKHVKQPEIEGIFYSHTKEDVIREMKDIGFTSMNTIEHTQEKQCYYIIGHKPLNLQVPE